MDVLRNSVTHHPVKSKFEKRLRIKSVTLSVTPAVPYRPTRGAVGLPFAPLFRSHTHSPIGPTALGRHRTGSHPKVTPWDGSPSPRAVHIDRTHSHGRARANVPWDGRDAHGTAHHETARARAHTPPTGPLRGPLRGLAPGQRAYSAACRCSPPPRAARARNTSCSRPSRC